MSASVLSALVAGDWKRRRPKEGPGRELRRRVGPRQRDAGLREFERRGVDIDALACAAIEGDYGNGDERKQRLGANYAAVQKRVNEMLS